MRDCRFTDSAFARSLMGLELSIIKGCVGAACVPPQQPPTDDT